MTTSEAGSFKKPRNDSRKQREDVQYVFRIDEDTIIDFAIRDVHLKLLVDSVNKRNLITEEI